MLKQPSSRRKSGREEITLNLVPMMDTFVTLIAFLLYTMAFLSMVMVETPLPTANPTDVAEKLKEKPLQLTISFRKDETEIWSPFQKIAAKKIKNLPEGALDLKVDQISVSSLRKLMVSCKGFSFNFSATSVGLAVGRGVSTITIERNAIV
jgi:biopolymer transport protein ExbD